MIDSKFDGPAVDREIERRHGEARRGEMSILVLILDVAEARRGEERREEESVVKLLCLAGEVG